MPRLENMYIQFTGQKIGRILLISNFFSSHIKSGPKKSYDSRKYLIPQRILIVINNEIDKLVVYT